MPNKNPLASPLQTGTVCLVRFHPSTGSELKRFRPAVIVSEKINQIDSRFVLVAPFTANTSSFNQDYELFIKKNNILEQDSVLLCWYLRIIDTNRVETVLGKLTNDEVEQIMQKTQQLFRPKTISS
ncbi:type II toxin-antitoxin system PemK/MazF family toxin [Patescibacteria group bacterium]|nr:type II toxin-antitoxin system PemK/MazF family toxin [Patescibacteria group bacterium]MBU2542942.1 type II toxin-antitoxin system PemK/MazF family toxin [Patescibacteria group bacterium]